MTFMAKNIEEQFGLNYLVDTPAMSQPMNVLTSKNTVEWFTPEKFIISVRKVIGEIELDPASCEFAQNWIRADRFFTKEDDGIVQDWIAKTVFLNPPYCGSTALWLNILNREYEVGHVGEAIALINSAPGYNWFEAIWRNYPVCMVRERIRFIKEGGTVGGQAKKGSCFILFPRSPETLGKFYTEFSKYGRIILPDYWLSFRG